MLCICVCFLLGHVLTQVSGKWHNLYDPPFPHHVLWSKWVSVLAENPTLSPLTLTYFYSAFYNWLKRWRLSKKQLQERNSDPSDSYFTSEMVLNKQVKMASKRLSGWPSTKCTSRAYNQHQVVCTKLWKVEVLIKKRKIWRKSGSSCVIYLALLVEWWHIFRLGHT